MVVLRSVHHCPGGTACVVCVHQILEVRPPPRAPPQLQPMACRTRCAQQCDLPLLGRQLFHHGRDPKSCNYPSVRTAGSSTSRETSISGAADRRSHHGGGPAVGAPQRALSRSQKPRKSRQQLRVLSNASWLCEVTPCPDPPEPGADSACPLGLMAEGQVSGVRCGLFRTPAGKGTPLSRMTQPSRGGGCGVGPLAAQGGQKTHGPRGFTRTILFISKGVHPLLSFGCCQQWVGVVVSEAPAVQARTAGFAGVFAVGRSTVHRHLGRRASSHSNGPCPTGLGHASPSAVKPGQRINWPSTRTIRTP